MSQIEIRPIEKEKWHKKKGAESFKQDVVIEALVDSRKNVFVTGLNEEEVKKYSAELGIDLNPAVLLDGKPHPFYGSKAGRLKLPNRTMFLEISNPRNFVLYKLALASKLVANSIKEYEEGLFPEASHVIFDEEQEINRKASKIQKKNAAIKKALKMTLEEKANIVLLLINKLVKGRSQDYIDVLIDEIIETQIDAFLTYSDMTKEELYTRAIILEALQRNVLTKEGSAICYMGNTLAHTFEDAIEYFKDANNQKLKVTILEKLN